MSELKNSLISKETGSRSPEGPILVQAEAVLSRQPFAEAHFLKVLKELEAPFKAIEKPLGSKIVCSCSCSLGLIAGLKDGSVVFVGYDAEVRILGKHEGNVSDVCTATDVVASAGDQTVRILSFEEGKQISVLEHPSQVYCVSISLDAKHVVSGSDDHAVRIWGLEERELLAVLEGHSEYVWRVSISPDGQYIVSGSLDCTVRIWSIEEQKQLASLEGHNTIVNSVLISSDGKHIVSTSNENTVRIWSLEERKLLAVLEGHTYPVKCVAISSDGKYIVSGSTDCNVRIWSIEEKKQLAILSGHSSNVNCIAITSDGKQIVWGSQDKTVRIWDLEERKKLAVLEGHDAVVDNLSISQDGKQVISTSQDMKVRIWTLEQRPQFAVLEGHTNNVVSVLSNGNEIISGSYDKTLRIWNTEERTQVAVLEGHTGWVYGLSISANGKQVASASRDETVRIWDLEKRKELKVLKHASFVYCVSFAPDGKHIVSGSGDSTVQIWDFEEEKQLAVLKGHSNIVWCLSISPDGRFIVSGSWDNTLLIWDFAGREQLAVLLGHTSNVRCISISADGKYVLSGSSDMTVRIWDLGERKQIAVLEGYSAGVNFIAMSSDGRHLISASHDKTLRIWDFEERKELAVLEGHTDSVQCLSITTDGRHVISGSKDKTIRIVEMTMILPVLRSEFLRANFDKKEPTSKTYYFYGKYQEYLKQGVPIASSVASSPILPHYFNSLHICAYYNQSTAFKDYLEKDVPIIRGVFGSPLTVALAKSSTKCVNVILQYLINKFERNQGFLVLQEIVEDFPKLLMCNAFSLVPFFQTLLGASTQSLPEYIAPLRKLPSALFQTQQLINLPDFAQYEGNELLTQNGELVKFWISRFNWNFALGSAKSLEFLRALEGCEDRHVLTTPLVNSLIQFKWETLLLITRTHTLLYVCLLISLVCLTFNYFRHDVVSLIFLFLNVLFVLYEIVQSLANRDDYWVDSWNYVDLLSSLTSVIWGYFVFSEVEPWPYLQFLVVFLCFLRGFTYFHTFQMTRIFVRMVIEVVKEMYAFLVILAYSTVSCGMMYAVLLPHQITSASEAWITAYELLMGEFNTDDFDLLKWLCFTAASLMNVIIMLNLLISILGDAYEKAQMSASEHDNLEMLKVVIEYESMLFWRRKAGQSNVMIVCKSAEEEDVADEWAGRVDNIKKALEKSLKDTESLLLKKLDATEKSLKDTESLLLKKMDATEKSRKDTESFLLKKLEATEKSWKDDEAVSSKKLEKKVEEIRTAMEESLQAIRTATETKIDQVLAALQAPH